MHGAIVSDPRGRTRELVGVLRDDVLALDDAITAVDPQLEIYCHDISEALKLYLEKRETLLASVESELNNEELLYTPEIRAIGWAQVALNANLSDAIDELRSFIASEFKFK